MKIGYSYRLLNRDGTDLGLLHGVARGAGQTTYAADAPIKSSGSITLHDTGQIADWLNTRIQPWVNVDGDEWPLGVFIPDVPGRDLNDMGETVTINLLDKLTNIEGDAYGYTYGLAANTDILATVRDIIESTGETATGLEDTDLVALLRTDAEWDPNATKLDIINDLLAAANLFDLWVDGRGRFRVSQWMRPSRRPVVAEFVDGENGVSLANVYAPNFNVTSDYGRTPNVYIAISQGDAVRPGLRAEAANMNPDDPFSLLNRGVRKLPASGVETGVKTTSQAALDEYAARRLIEESEPQETVTIAHPPKRLAINDVVKFRSRKHDIEGLFTVSQMRWTHAFNGLVETTLRKVVDL